MKKRNILMCLEFLGVGGVETAVVTLCKGYVRAGHNVFVAAKDGIYAKELEKIGVKVLKMEHKIRNYFRIDKKKELMEFCKENKILVYIQFIGIKIKWMHFTAHPLHYIL